ncbi:MULTISPECIES: helix-turn-helix domain-containing protein [Colwellia]|uniref:Transcriptional regulator n=1 Tax=Colwellia marinimaniae TaxID=1513592 RepID=A0ABQ0MYQ3_9GAMM|nr:MULTISPECIES: helix-turn-helix domain-containing protein [Colwellia]GAW97503.1 transcriptional regulator [Colwellia marinimaniae]
MNIQHITDLAQQLQNEMPFITGINSAQENEAALELMNELTDDYDNNLLLIDVLWAKIEDYENNASELAAFNQRIENLNNGSSMLRLLMVQHGLNTTSFAQEIGGKSTVSMIFNEKRKLTVEHIEKLSARFEISPALFF